MIAENSQDFDLEPVSVTKSFRMRRSEVEALTRHAERIQRSESAVIRAALRQFLGQHAPAPRVRRHSRAVREHDEAEPSGEHAE